MNRKSLAVLLTVIMLFALMPAPALADVGEVFTSNNVKYKVLEESGTTGTVQVGDDSSIAAVAANTQTLTIPATVTNTSGGNTYTYTVTKIGDYAFYNCASLTNVTMTNVTSIGGSAFYGCEKLALTALPASVTSIGEYAFWDCKNLALTALPSGVTSISYSTFYSCTSLINMNMPNVTSIGGWAFYNCASLTNVTMTNVTSIGNYAFAKCQKLALTALPSSLTSIGEGAFSNCQKLALTALPSGVTSIGGGAFYYCEKLALSELPSSLTNIGDSAFLDCSSLNSITCSRTNAPTLGTNVFYGVAATGTLYIPAGATGYTTLAGWPWVSPAPAPAPAPAPTTPGFTITVPTAPTSNSPSTEPQTGNPPVITDPTENKTETIAPPQTGDTSAPVFIGIAMLLTGFAVSILIRRRSAREN